MIKLDIKKPKKLPDIKRFQKELITKQFLKDIGTYISTAIYKRVKAGYGVDSLNKDPDSTNKKKLTPIVDQYKKRRRGLVEFYARKKNGDTVKVKFKIAKPRLGAFGTPNKSNLTFTGEMLESIEFKVSGESIRLMINKKRRSDGHTNEEIATLVSEQGRPFFAITKEEMRGIRAMIDRRANMLIKKYFS